MVIFISSLGEECPENPTVEMFMNPKLLTEPNSCVTSPENNQKNEEYSF